MAAALPDTGADPFAALPHALALAVFNTLRACSAPRRRRERALGGAAADASGRDPRASCRHGARVAVMTDEDLEATAEQPAA
jgi:hypothetical protein